MRTELKITPSHRFEGPAVAWLVAGSAPQTWFQELGHWDCELDSVVFRPIPRAINDPVPLGALVTLETTSSDSRSTSRINSGPNLALLSGQRALPYRCLADRLFVPVDATVFPDVGESELLSLLPSDDADFVWHPNVGLIQIDPDERLRVDDLLLRPVERTAAWDRALPGVVFPSRLISIDADDSLTVEEVFERAATDIGSHNDSLDRLPPTPDEWLSGKLNRWTKPLRSGLRKLKDSLKRVSDSQTPSEPGKNAPNTAASANSRSSWWASTLAVTIGAIETLARGLDSITQGFAPISRPLGKMLSRFPGLSLIDQLTRDREVDRLMQLLKDDPDAGLRFAIPMSSTNRARGHAHPSNQLLARDLNFHLGGLHGDGPADVWDIPADLQFKLMMQYRELALREIRLGRHRRAAYIYAKLLNDFAAAASALESGHHYREAAVLYRDKLNRPVDGAKCLERAGLLDEAVELYVNVGMFEHAAELYLRLDRKDDADQLLRSYAEQLIANEDYFNASRILHDKLSDVDGALQTLARGWPSSPSALACLNQSFVLMGRHARHNSALEQIAELKTSVTDVETSKLLSIGLANVATGYPDSAIRATALDATQVVVARALPRANRTSTTQLLSTIRKLVPQDRLLARDCDRFLRIEQEKLAPGPKLRRTGHGISVEGSFSLLLKPVSWRTAKSVDKAVYVAGYSRSSLVLQRLEWKNTRQHNQRAYWADISDVRKIILEPASGDAGDVIIHPIGSNAERRGIPKGDGTIVMAGSPKWASPTSIAAGRARGGFCWDVNSNLGKPCISCFDPDGNLRVTDLGCWNLQFSTAALFIADKSIWASLGCRLFLRKGVPAVPSDTKSIQPSFELVDGPEFLEDIQDLVGFQSHDETWICALFETGAAFVSDSTPGIHISISAELASPCATFLQDGRLVVAGLHEVQAYRIDRSRPTLIGRVSIDHKPVAVTTTNTPGQFAVFCQEGQVQLMSL
jgi:tetratricopeptide (TPR) repeat protein